MTREEAISAIQEEFPETEILEFEAEEEGAFIFSCKFPDGKMDRLYVSKGKNGAYIVVIPPT